ncbi:Sugar lactone lactonase YvrE [Devosia crocina]|uniref:Sugar lactone lactonase YvrE n=1 Tax=Devosia crocina TaxID=429728 RepID=A0A1I7NCW9_9HYPH|nr:SMP-30/gluconolactonase/LRE family protein [Devosia crocina]SFV32396.1 Sugar lactone lactonase YvrE [Devosia crocina]
MSETARLLIDSKCELGEGPIWHAERQQLFWFDINEQSLFAANTAGKIEESWLFNEAVTAAAIIDRDRVAIASENGLIEFDLRVGGMNRLEDIERDVPANRSNDSRVHPSGAFWIGTMVKDEGPKNGAVYHYRAGQLTRIIENVAIPNATCFSPDGRIAYFTDTPTKKILKCLTDPETGLPQGEWEVFADVADGRGHPDGAVVDSEGYLWNAKWGGSCVVRHAPDGSIDRIVEVPVSQVTCPAFGGKDLKTLFITTAAKGLSPEQLAAEKVAGGVFAIEVDVAGQPETPIKL